MIYLHFIIVLNLFLQYELLLFISRWRRNEFIIVSDQWFFTFSNQELSAEYDCGCK